MGATLAGVLVAALAIAGLPHTSRASPQVGVTLLNDNVMPGPTARAGRRPK